MTKIIVPADGITCVTSLNRRFTTCTSNDTAPVDVVHVPTVNGMFLIFVVLVSVLIGLAVVFLIEKTAKQ